MDNNKQAVVSTDELLSLIIKEENINHFISDNARHLTLPALAEHLEHLCIIKNIKPGDVIKNADIDRVYGAQIFQGKRVNPSRDYLLRIAFGLGLNLEECQKLLDITRESRLYARVPRDAVIINCIHNKKTYHQTEDTLFEMNLPLLSE